MCVVCARGVCMCAVCVVCVRGGMYVCGCGCGVGVVCG